MMQTSPTPLIVAGLCGVLLGAGLTYAALPPSPTPSRTRPAVQAPAPCLERTTPKPSQAAKTSPTSQDLTECRSTLGRLKKAYEKNNKEAQNNTEIIDILENLVAKTGADSRDGNPMTEWPKSLADRLRPEGFANALEELKTQCPDQFPASTKADCSEFPCTIALTVDETKKPWKGTKECPAYNALMPNGASTHGSGFTGASGEKLHTMHITPYPEDAETRAYMEEYEANLHKRARARHRDFVSKEQQSMLATPCEQDRNPEACAELGRSTRKSDPEAAKRYTEMGCEYGSARACNNIAWTRCHDDNICDETAIASAERATELNPNDGKGAWDTLAFTLCKAGRTEDANRAYARSCQAGYTANCSKTCTP